MRIIDENLERYNTTAEITAQKEHNVQAVYTVSMGNCIASLKYVSSLNWPELFESISFLEKILRQDPDGTYRQMDINSRNRYKEQIGQLAKFYRVSELHIAKEAIELASKAVDAQGGKRAHVGYYLTGAGLKLLEAGQTGEIRFTEQVKRILAEQLGVIYIGFIAVMTLILTGLCVGYAADAPGRHSSLLVVLAAAVVLIPSSEVAVTAANWLACKVKKPAFIPRLELEDGIPQTMSTMVVIPAILSDEKTVAHLLDNIESHYLA